jgi:ribosomal protein L35
MPKLKTRKTLMKRIKITKSHKVLQKRVGNGHLKVKKDSSNKHKLNKTITQTTKGYLKGMTRLLARESKGLIKGNRN